MNSRLKGMGIILAIFIALKVYYYEIIIVTAIELRMVCAEIIKLKSIVI